MRIIILLMLLLPTIATAREGFTMAFAGMAFTNSTKQGGKGSQGSTLLTETNFTYHAGWWGAGAFFQFDKQGSNETDTCVGPRLEFSFDPFYFDFSYAVMMKRAFTDRSIAEQSGTATMLGVGARFPLGEASFLQFAYRYRTQQIKKQDSVDLGEPVTQMDGYPLFGIGWGF